MRRPGRLLRDRKGISAVEFALIAPVMILMIVGLTQIGRLFFADADLRSALAAGARQATIYPMPSDDVILDTVESRLTGLNPDLLVNEIDHFVAADGSHHAELRVSYAVTLDFLFFDWGPITLEATRTVYTNDPASTWATTSTSASSTGGTTTSAGGTTSTGGTTTTSAGGTTTSTGGTTTTSAGGTTTTSGGTTTTSGGTTTTSGGTTTTSGGTTTTSGGTTTTSGGTTTTSGGTTTTSSTSTSSTSSTSSSSGGSSTAPGRTKTGGTCRRC